MQYKDSPYFHVGRASDLTGSDRALYRALEILPGFLSWGTILGTLILSFYAPVWAAYFIILFDLYWLLKTIYLSLHLRHNWKRFRFNLKVDWNERLQNLKYEHVYHLVLLPFYKESIEVVTHTLDSIRMAHGDKKNMIIVLAGEERAKEHANEVAVEIQRKFGDTFGHFLFTLHPSNVSGEMVGKGSNISYAAEEARNRILDINHVPYENVIVSAFDIDTVVYP